MLKGKRYTAFFALLLAGLFMFPPELCADDEEFEIEAPVKKTSSSVQQAEKEDPNVEFEIVGKQKEAAEKEEIIKDDPNFEIVRFRTNKAQKKLNQSEAMAKYEKEKKIYDEWVREKQRPRKFLFYSYIPYDNTINGIDARLFITGMLVSVFYVLAMLAILVYELGRRPRIYSVEQMVEFRAQGYGQISERDADILAENLWKRTTGGKTVKEDDLPIIENRGELSTLAAELEAAASALPTNPESVHKLNRVSDTVNLWRTRFLVAPFISSESGWFKRILMTIIYLILVFYVYPGHPMYLLVIFCPLAFLTPAYLVDDRENSKIYRLLGGSLKIFGKMTGSAMNTLATGEGSTVTVYTNSWGNVKAVEHNYWGTIILFGLKIAVAVFFIYLVFILAPLIVLYGLIRNYILAK